MIGPYFPFVGEMAAILSVTDGGKGNDRALHIALPFVWTARP